MSSTATRKYTFTALARGACNLFWLLPVVLAGGCSGPQQQGPLTVATALAGGGNTGYRKADAVRKFVFPEDHGSHPSFKSEWWYFTGNVKTANGREFGYQFTIFRNAIRPGGTAAADNAADTGSHWNTNQIYMAHAALSDIRNGRFYYDEQFSRGVLGMAGAVVRPLRVWLNQWSVTGRDNPCQDCFAVELTVAARDFRLQMQLNNTRDVVLHGQQGLSAKSPDPGNASYYYSFVRLQTNGRIIFGDNTYPVSGDSWFDHEWSSSALARDQQGWDWFGLQLSNNTEIMLYRLRNDTDAGRDFYYGSLIQAGSALHTLGGKGIKIHGLDSWLSPVSGVRYPTAWRIDLPGFRLTVNPKMPNQELNTSIRYWEGAVRVSGTAGRGKVTGEGYVELTGYR